jgi:hypothetical protein
MKRFALVFGSLLLGAFLGIVLFIRMEAVHAQDVGSIDVVTMAAIASGSDGPSAKAQPKAKQSCKEDFTGVEILSLRDYRGDDSVGYNLREHVVERWHDKESGVEFICVKNHGCVLTGRKW